MTIGKKILDSMYFVVVVMVVVILLGYICGIRSYVTMSGSMEPVIKTGSLCFVNTNETYEKIKEGDVIVFRSIGESLVTHRVISITEEGMETKGDNNEISDGISTTEENFMGKTLFSVPYVGYVIHFWKSTYAVVVAMGVVVVGVVGMIVQSLFRKKEDFE